MRAADLEYLRAHRLLHWAGVEGKQVALKQTLLHGYFGEGRNVSDRDTLVAIASAAGWMARVPGDP